MRRSRGDHGNPSQYSKSHPGGRIGQEENLREMGSTPADNAPVHTARLVTDFLDTWNVEMLEHPRYSPDLAPADFCIFSKIKESLRSRRFESQEDIIRAASASHRHLDEGTFQDAFQSLVRRWQKCLDNDGQYIE